MNEAMFLQKQQPFIYQHIQKSLKQGRLAHAYIFEGDTGTGKKECGVFIAKRIFCTNVIDDLPCNVCNNCIRIAANEHPDVLTIVPEGQTIKVDQIRHLKKEYSKHGVESSQKIFLIEQADKMGTGAANSLLKLIEEPQGQVFLVLETNALGKLLPTIRSRCQVLHFYPYPKEALIEALMKENIEEKKAIFLAGLTNSFDKAVEISQKEWFNESKDVVQQWFTYLQNKDLQAFIYVQKVLNGTFKDKEQQFFCFDLLLVYFRKQLEQDVLEGTNTSLTAQQAQKIERILQARQKFEMNVSFQNACEQLVLRMIHVKHK